ncbi:hypothetical protein JCM14469_42740 [Desulfatiferula olefinivorans]
MKKLFVSIALTLSLFSFVGCKVSGKITLNGEPLSGVEVVLSGDASAKTITSSNGEYCFDVHSKKSGEYVITPQPICFDFYPEQINVQVNYQTKDNDFSNFNFSAEERVYNGNYIVYDVEDLNNLSGYSKIEGNLIIQQTELEDLSGLECLTIVEGNVYIFNNIKLKNIDALSNLTITGGFIIGNQPNITKVNFPLLVQNTGSFELIRTGLTDLTGFENLSYIGKFVNIWDNDSLTTVDGLENLINIDGYLSVWDNDNLENLNGLSNIYSIDGDYKVTYNDSLCNSLAYELRYLIDSRGGINGEVEIINNMICIESN